MAVVNVNGISGINSITAQSNALDFYNSAGNTLSIGANLTGNVTGNATGLSGTPNITVGSIIASSATISGNVSVAGTLTYEDVTNVDSLGIVTARTGVRIDAGGLVVVGVTTVAAGTTAAPSISPTGDSNTGIFFPSADTIAIGEGGVEALRIDSSGNLGIGTNSVPNWAAGGFLAVQNKTASLVSSGSQDAFLTSNAYYDGAWKYQNTGVARNIYMNSDGLVFRMAPSGSANASITWTEAARFNNTGNLVFPSGQGIDFSATANSSGTMTSELLSDYEEGTWSPTFIGEGVNPTVTYSLQLGRYVKIGQMVYASGNITLSAVSGTGSSNLQIGGWPFTVGPSATTDRTTVVDVGFANNWTTASPTRGYLREGQTGAYLTTISGTTVTFITTNHLQSTSALYFKIVYTTSA